MSKVLQNSGTHLPQSMNTSSFHQNVGEGNKSLYAMSPDPFLRVVVKGLTNVKCSQGPLSRQQIMDSLSFVYVYL